jgi:hypothetical protein
LITKYLLDAGAHLRARRIGGLLRLTEFAIAIGPAMNAALQAALSELFLDGETFIAWVRIEEAKLSHANLPRSEHENLESDLRGGGKRLFFEIRYSKFHAISGAHALAHAA